MLGKHGKLHNFIWTASPNAGKMNSTFLESTFQNDSRVLNFL